MKYTKFTSFDGTILQSYVWDDVRAPKGVVQIAHGMAEHARRYDDFATFLNKNGFIVFADDHRAHGNSEKKADIGYHGGDIFADTVKDEIAITKYLEEKYKLPVVFIGHSYGSFLGQGYIQNGGRAKGVILSGSANMKGGLAAMGGMIANMQYKLCGAKKPGKFMDKIGFGGYNKPFEKEGVKFAWLSRDHAQDKKYFEDAQCGYVMSLAFYKYFFKGLKELYGESLNNINKDIPLALFSGGVDPVGGKGKLITKLYDMYKELGLTNVSLKLYEDARHEILNETNNAEVYADMLAFVKSSIA